MDWKEFVEASSLMEQILRTDPAAVYGHGLGGALAAEASAESAAEAEDASAEEG